MLSLKSAAKMLDPNSQKISTKGLAQKMSLHSPISLLSLLRHMSIWGNRVDNVEQALNAVNKSGKFYYLEGKCDGLPQGIIPDAHVQGVASYNDYIIMTHSAQKLDGDGWLVILNKKSNKIVQRVKTPVLREINHPGGIQQIGNYLAVSLEPHYPKSKLKTSFILFYDLRQLSDTQPPILLEKPIITRKDKKAGAVGITTYKEEGIDKFLVAVYDNGSVDFYKSNGKLLSDPECNFEFISSCNYTGADNLCLVTDKQEKVYMIGLRSRMETRDLIFVKTDVPVADYVDLYLIDTSTMTINPIAQNIHFISNDKMLANEVGVHFRYGAGIRIVSPQNIEVLATQRNFEISNKIGINIFS